MSLTGSRTTAAVAGVAPAGTPTGTALLDDVTLSNAGLREDTTVIVSAVRLRPSDGPARRALLAWFVVPHLRMLR